MMLFAEIYSVARQKGSNGSGVWWRVVARESPNAYASRGRENTGKRGCAHYYYLAMSLWIVYIYSTLDTRTRSHPTLISIWST